MNNQTTGRERIKMSSMSFLEALKPKITRTTKQKPKYADRGQSRGLFSAINERLSGIPGTI